MTAYYNTVNVFINAIDSSRALELTAAAAAAAAGAFTQV